MILPPTTLTCTCGRTLDVFEPCSPNATYKCWECFPHGRDAHEADGDVPPVKMPHYDYEDGLRFERLAKNKKKKRDPNHKRSLRRPDDYQPFKFDSATARHNIGWSANCFSPRTQQKAFSAEMRVQRKLQRNKYNELRKRAARQRRLLEQNKNAERLHKYDSFYVGNFLAVTREDFLAGRGCDCDYYSDKKTLHTHKPVPVVYAMHLRTLVYLFEHPELDVDDAPTQFFDCWQNRGELEKLRKFWLSLEKGIEVVRSGEMRCALWEVVVLERDQKDVSAKYGVTLSALDKATDRLFVKIRKSFVWSKVSPAT